MCTRVTIRNGEILVDLEPITPMPQNFYLFYSREYHSFMIWAGKVMPGVQERNDSLAVCFLVDCNMEESTMDIKRIVSIPLRVVAAAQLCQYDTGEWVWADVVLDHAYPR